MAIWKAQRTLLLVGEGHHEEAFLKHVKGLYVPRSCGLSVKIKNARGKGAKHVVEYTAKQMTVAYDACAAMLDTDTDFTTDVINFAKSKNIVLLPSNPCFEAMLLRLLGQKPHRNRKHWKKQFAPFVDYDPTEHRHYVRHFSRELLEDGREHEQKIDNLLLLLHFTKLDD